MRNERAKNAEPELEHYASVAAAAFFALVAAAADESEGDEILKHSLVGYMLKRPAWVHISSVDTMQEHGGQRALNDIQEPYNDISHIHKRRTPNKLKKVRALPPLTSR